MAEKSMSLQKLLGLYREKEQLCLETLELTEEQAKILRDLDPQAEYNFTPFEDLLEKRQECMDRISTLDQEITALNDRYKDRVGETLEEITQIKDNIDSILKKARKVDSQNRSLLKKAMSRLFTRMQSLQAGKKSSGAYAKLPRQLQGFFIDKKK